MRRILRKIAQGQTEDFGDITTLADQKTISDILLKKYVQVVPDTAPNTLKNLFR